MKQGKNKKYLLNVNINGFSRINHIFNRMKYDIDIKLQLKSFYDISRKNNELSYGLIIRSFISLLLHIRYNKCGLTTNDIAYFSWESYGRIIKNIDKCCKTEGYICISFFKYNMGLHSDNLFKTSKLHKIKTLLKTGNNILFLYIYDNEKGEIKYNSKAKHFV